MFYDAVYPEYGGGVESRNFHLATELAARGHAVTIAGWFSSRMTPPPSVQYVRLGPHRNLYGLNGRRSTRAALDLAKSACQIDVRGFDVVETANIPYVHIIPLAARCRLYRIPLVVTWHEYWGLYWRTYAGVKWPLYGLAEFATAQLGTQTVAVSSLTAARLRARRCWRGVEVVPNGIPVERIGATAKTGVTGTPLVYAGRLLREKRLDLLLRAVQFLDSVQGPVVTIIGEGPDGPRLRALTSALGIADRVNFAGHLQSAEDVWRVLGSARMAVQPSSREGFGLFPLEAMAAGLPVIYCKSPESALGELVRHGVDGVECEADPQSLATTLNALLADPQALSHLSSAALTRSREFAWTEVATKIERVFRHATAG